MIDVYVCILFNLDEVLDDVQMINGGAYVVVHKECFRANLTDDTKIDDVDHFVAINVFM